MDEPVPLLEGLTLSGFSVRRDFEKRTDVEGIDRFIPKNAGAEPRVDLYIRFPGAGVTIQVEIEYREFMNKVFPRVRDARAAREAKKPDG